MTSECSVQCPWVELKSSGSWKSDGQQCQPVLRTAHSAEETEAHNGQEPSSQPEGWQAAKQRARLRSPVWLHRSTTSLLPLTLTLPHLCPHGQSLSRFLPQHQGAAAEDSGKMQFREDGTYIGFSFFFFFLDSIFMKLLFNPALSPDLISRELEAKVLTLCERRKMPI